MRFVFTIEVDVEREEGKFESRESIGDVILQALEEADWGSWEGANDGVYSTTQWDVTQDELPKRRRS